MTEQSVYAGIDVSKARLDLALRPEGTVRTAAYDTAGIQDLVSELQSLGPSVVVLESTGGLELFLAGALAAASLPVVVVNPSQVRDFAKATGRLAKTDVLDVQVLAHFAEAVRPEVRPMPDSDTQEFHSLTTRRTQVMEMLVAERNPWAAPAVLWPLASGTTSIGWSGSWTSWINGYSRPCAAARCGGSRTTCCAPFQEWGRTLCSAAFGPAGTGDAGAQADSGFGGSGSHEPEQQDHEGQENYLRGGVPGCGLCSTRGHWWPVDTTR